MAEVGPVTPAGRAAFALYALALVGSVSQGATHLQAGASREGLVFYAVALAVLVGMLREASRTVLDEARHNDGPGRWRRWRADRQARRLLRAEECTCEVAWLPPTGRPHAPWCPASNDRSSSL
jgi:hypothetical protein